MSCRRLSVGNYLVPPLLALFVGCTADRGENRLDEPAQAPQGSRKLSDETHAHQAIEKQRDAVNIQGTWSVVRGSFDGQATQAPVGEWWTFKDDVVVVRDKNKERKPFTLHYEIDPLANPKKLDMTTDHAGATPFALCIYKLEGDELTICRGHITAPRPDSFSTVPGDGKGVTVLKRAAE